MRASSLTNKYKTKGGSSSTLAVAQDRCPRKFCAKLAARQWTIRAQV